MLEKLWKIIFSATFRDMVRRYRIRPQVLLRYNHGENKNKHANKITKSDGWMLWTMGAQPTFVAGVLRAEIGN